MALCGRVNGVDWEACYVRISIVTQCTFYSVFPSVGEGTQDSGRSNVEKKKGKTSKGALLGIVKGRASPNQVGQLVHIPGCCQWLQRMFVFMFVEIYLPTQSVNYSMAC